MASGAQVLDVRDPAEFSAGHLVGSINVGLSGQFASWAGTVLDREQPILLVASPGLEKQATTRLGRIGFDHVGGYLDQGMAALESHSEHVARTPRIAATTLAEQMASGAAPLLLDIRADKERRDKFIEGSLHIPLNHLRDRVGVLPSDQPLVVHCAGGYRSSIAASIIKRHGNPNVSELLGGIAAWEKSGLPVAGQTSQRSNTVKPTNFSERVLEVAGWKLRLTSYELGGKYFCKADNVEPGACIARTEGVSKEECEQKALEKAQEYLSRTRRFLAS
jgi:rhodanese-related sulfurtransferase